MKHFEETLPEGYKLVKTVDVKDKKTVIIMNVAAALVAAALIAAAFFIFDPFADFHGEHFLLRELVLIVSMLVYIVAHELTHGAAYKLLTHRKLTFGMTLSVAFCGVPDIYVYRTAALIALLAPFTVFTVLFGLLIFLMPGNFDKFLASLLFAVHFSGCVGDLNDTFLYLFRFRDKTTLMNDTGPKQTFYVKEK